jgi:hypothetical protein
MDSSMTPVKPKSEPKAGYVYVRYIGRKDVFTSFKRPKLKTPVVFKDKVAEVPSALGHALAKTYPMTFKNLTEPVIKSEVLPEV